MREEWVYAQTRPDDRLARLHEFSMSKEEADRVVEFRITVQEFVPDGEDDSRRFVATADKQTNQEVAPFTPQGWGSTLGKALSECVQAIHKFPYQGD